MPNNKHIKKFANKWTKFNYLNILFDTYVTDVDYFAMKLPTLYLIPNPNATLCETKYAWQYTPPSQTHYLIFRLLI
jgi:hypothetical protein